MTGTGQAEEGRGAPVADHLVSQRAEALSGEVRVPGDKSISHRAIILSALSSGDSTIRGFLRAEDTLATLEAVRSLGVSIEQARNGLLRVRGRGPDALRAPTGALDLGNSGTGIRLLTGVLAGCSFPSVLTGDASLCRRPMERIAAPLRRMGASIELSETGTPPIHITPVGGRLRGIDYDLPVASAQLKSALLLAALGAEGVTRLREPEASRDHTERMLSACGVRLTAQDRRIELEGGQGLRGIEFEVPADPSSAAFFVVAGLIVRGSGIRLPAVSINQTRIGFIGVLEAMGARVGFDNERAVGGEPVADVTVRSQPLSGVHVAPGGVARFIDELPILFIAASVAAGRSRFEGIGELRVKESDRIAVMAEGLRELGVEVNDGPDWIEIEGGRLRGGEVDAGGDHRCAMAFAVAGAVAAAPVGIRNCAEIATSYPDFPRHAASLGLRLRTAA